MQAAMRFKVGDVVRLNRNVSKFRAPGVLYLGTECSVLRIVIDGNGVTFQIGDGSGVWAIVGEEAIKHRRRNGARRPPRRRLKLYPGEAACDAGREAA